MSEPSCSCLFHTNRVPPIAHRSYLQFRSNTYIKSLCPGLPTPQLNEETPKIFISRGTPYQWQRQQNKEAIDCTRNYASIANFQEKYPAVFRSIFRILCRISGLYLFIYSTIFRGTRVGNPRGKHYKEQWYFIWVSFCLALIRFKNSVNCYNAFGTLFPSGCL